MLSVTTLLLIRHGQTPNNVIGALDTALPGAGLTELGQRQAEDLVERLHGTQLDGVLASAHDRARLTATPLVQSRGLSLTQDARFGEIQAGDLEMATDEAAHHTYLMTAFAWANGDLEARMPGGESGAEALARFNVALDERLATFSPDATVAIVSHGAMIRTWTTSHATGLTPQDVEHRRLWNTAILRVQGRPGSWEYLGWDEPRLLDLSADDPTGEAEE